jgi:protein-S-isoprenylcysteine O-methyltransferase Ste14
MKHCLYTEIAYYHNLLIKPLHGGEEQLSKDQAIGGIIFAVCLIIGILYTLGLFYFGDPLKSWSVAFWLIAIPVFLAFIAILAIGAWIGWTMATTPPPKPIEEITEETEEKKETEQGKEKQSEE